MGHHRFDITSKSKSLGAKTDIADQVEVMNLNGLQRITQAHQQLLEQTRRRLSDRISSRMGELLLLGHTMLNEYCESCTGILMEDRQGVRSCVTCDMVNRELSREQGGRSPVSINDDMNDLDETTQEHSNMSQDNEVSQTNSAAGSAHRPVETELGTLHNVRQLVEAGKSSHAGFLGSRSVSTAIEAVDDKLKWCAQRLKNCENLEEVMKLYEIIDRGIGILKNCTDT